MKEEKMKEGEMKEEERRGNFKFPWRRTQSKSLSSLIFFQYPSPLKKDSKAA